MTLKSDNDFSKMADKGNKIELSTFQKHSKLEIAGYKTVDENGKRLLTLFGASYVLSTNKLSFYLSCSFYQFYLVCISNFLQVRSHCKFIYVYDLLHTQNFAHERTEKCILFQ